MDRKRVRLVLEVIQNTFLTPDRRVERGHRAHLRLVRVQRSILA